MTQFKRDKSVLTIIHNAPINVIAGFFTALPKDYNIIQASESLDNDVYNNAIDSFSVGTYNWFRNNDFFQEDDVIIECFTVTKCDEFNNNVDPNFSAPLRVSFIIRSKDKRSKQILDTLELNILKVENGKVIINRDYVKIYLMHNQPSCPHIKKFLEEKLIDPETGSIKIRPV